MLDGVTIVESKAQKDELLLTGNDIENVSQSGSATWSFLACDIDAVVISCVNPGYLSCTEQRHP
jgi:hypothetical protein